MKDTNLWLIWIPPGVILLVFIIQHLYHRLERQIPNRFWGYNRNTRVFMKDSLAPLLAIVFVLYSLIALISVEQKPDSTSSPVVSNQERISDLGLRFAFKR